MYLILCQSHFQNDMPRLGVGLCQSKCSFCEGLSPSLVINLLFQLLKVVVPHDDLPAVQGNKEKKQSCIPFHTIQIIYK